MKSVLKAATEYLIEVVNECNNDTLKLAQRNGYYAIDRVNINTRGETLCNGLTLSEANSWVRGYVQRQHELMTNNLK